MQKQHDADEHGITLTPEKVAKWTLLYGGALVMLGSALVMLLTLWGRLAPHFAILFPLVLLVYAVIALSLVARRGTFAGELSTPFVAMIFMIISIFIGNLLNFADAGNTHSLICLIAAVLWGGLMIASLPAFLETLNNTKRDAATHAKVTGRKVSEPKDADSARGD